MSRSVNTHKHSVKTIYLDGSDYYEDYGWSDFIDDLKAIVKAKYPSFKEISRWDGNEVLEILENNYAVISVSQYNELISVSISPQDYYWDTLTGLANNWLKQNANNLADLIEHSFKPLRLVARASNGEAFFEPKT